MKQRKSFLHSILSSLFISMILLHLFTSNLLAQEEPGKREGKDFESLTDAQISERTDTLQKYFDDTSFHSSLWYNGWLGIYALSTLGAVAISGSTEMPASRQNDIFTSYALGVDNRYTALIAAQGSNQNRITDTDRFVSYALAGTDGLVLTTIMKSSYEEAEKLRHIKQDNIVNGWTGALAFTGMALTPYPASYASKEYRNLETSSRLDRQNKLAMGEQWLYQSADTEVFGRSWVNHAINFVVAAASGLAISSGYDRSASDGWTMFATNMIGGEVAIFTQPTLGIETWDNYKARYYTGKPNAKTETKFHLRSFSISPRAFSISFVF